MPGDEPRFHALGTTELERTKIEANRRDVTYQSLIKIWLADRLDRE